MSLFGDLDIESAEDNPFAIPDGTYNAFVYDIKAGKTKSGDKFGLTIIYKVSDEAFEGRMAQEWKHVPQPADPKNLSEEDQRSMSFLKQRMQSLGVPNDKINSVTPDDLIGTEVVITLVTKGEYQNVRKVVTKTNTDNLDVFKS